MTDVIGLAGSTYAGARPGSGKNFAKLKGALAKRGARNPGALAAYIGRKKYGRKGFAKLGAKGRSHAHASTGLPSVDLARAAYSRHPGEDVRCPSCGKYNMDDARYCDQCGAKLPESAFEHAASVPGLELAMPAARLPVSSPYDLIISRDADGTAVVRHRRGGGEIARIRRGDQGWVAAVGGKDLSPHTRQRGALLEAIGTHNKAAGSPYHRPQAASEPLQPKPQQTPAMAALGIPAVSAAQLATPVNGAGDGPRVTGLGPGGLRIYKKLRARGFPDARAKSFASRAERRMKAA